MLLISEKLKTTYPGGFIGAVLIKNASNSEFNIRLEKKKEELENALRAKYENINRSDLSLTGPIKTYVNYYKRFKKTYQVLLQLESIVLKKKSIPNVAPLVEAMFMAELKNLLLTAGHDMDVVRLPIRVDLSQGNERYILLNGQEKELAPGDMMMVDGSGIISSIIYGPDNRTKITQNTKNVLFVVYAPPGINEGLLEQHLQDIIQYVKIVSPDAILETQKVYRI
ncbi:MAG: phenylalanine--tRNA ligase beta subunit-related protein [Lutisporaceae bacterium]|jgi:DNA/RNA-binding domain of Phe-tRNA-synthetase-like protein